MAGPVFLLAPGAGAPSSHPRMRTFARLLETIGPVEPFDYPYALAGRGRPDPLPKLIEAHRAALAALRAKHGGPIVLAGKSMGGRVGCHVALVDPVEAVICFGYPLCGAGDRSKLRDQVLMELKTPILFAQGTRDPLCPLDLRGRSEADASALDADVVPIDVDECSASCISPTSDDEAALAGDVTLSLSGGGGAGDPSVLRPDLIFDSRALPPVLVSGLPSPILSVGARAFDDPGVSPYAFFETIIDVPDSADAQAFTAVPFAPSLTGQLSAFLWASNDFFGPPSDAIASRRGLPVSVDADYLTGRLTTGWTTRTRVTPTLSPSRVSGPPSSSAAEPFGQVGNGAGRSAEFSSDGAGSSK